MRDVLALLEGQRLTVTGTVLRLSSRMAWAGVREPTVMLGQITTLDGTLLTDHTWFTIGKRLAAADLHRGDVVQCSARVARYRRGFHRDEDGTLHFTEDVGLGYPTRVLVLSRQEPAVQGVPTAATKPTAAQKIVTTIAGLWQEHGEPPALPHLVTATQLTPMTVVENLRRLARAGIVVFQGDGSVFVRSTSSKGGQ